MSKVLLIGSGGREHALASALVSSDQVQSVIVSPGNAGTQFLPKTKNQLLNIKDHKEIVEFCVKTEICLVVIGPEDPLAEGLTDSLLKANIKVFGPTKAAAKIETSKAWSKSFMKRNGIPTADFEVFETLEHAQNYIQESSWEGFVVKVSGLAGGKGVIVADDKNGANIALQTFKCSKSSKMVKAAEQIVLEEKLSGFEISIIALSDGSNIQVLPPVQDHKPRFAGGMGKNTGGMGAYCPCPLVSKEYLDFIENFILQKTVDAMKREGYEFVGALYAGIMVTEDGPKVLEFNCRFGDPETQALMPLYPLDIFSTMQDCANKNLSKSYVDFGNENFCAAVSIVIENYPDDVEEGLDQEIKGIVEAKKENCLIYLAGAKYDKEMRTLKTSGGRVMSVCSVGKSLQDALSCALTGASKISFEGSISGFGADFRGDIGFQSIKKLNEGRNLKLTYKNVGVDVKEGNRFVNTIKEFCDKTKRPGVRSKLGMFGAVFDTKLEGYSNPLLISGTDGVGTKLKVAIESNFHDTVGQDLVAMCVNDILVHAAEPLFFLDYFASGKLDPDSHVNIVKGISNGCLLAKCSLIGGETAEMPGMYKKGDYDLAGFVVGAVNEDKLLPKLSQMKPGNILIGVASSGLHSNGFTLIRKVIETLNINVHNPSPFSRDNFFYEELLKPTMIYTPLLNLLRSGLILGAAHVTGGGIEENILRVVPDNFGVKMKANWKIPSIYAWLSALGMDSFEMFRTFNLGIGLILIAEEKDKDTILKDIDEAFKGEVSADEFATYPKCKAEDDGRHLAWVIGSICERKGGKDRFEISDLKESLLRSGSWLIDMSPKCVSWTPRKRTAVLISGSGTNLQALLDHTMTGLSKAEIVLVISNVAGVQGLKRAADADVPTVVIPHKNFVGRENFEKEIQKVLSSYNIEIVCLAGFMRILTGSFVRKWENRMINIHPSLLPSFKGIEAQKQALDAGVCITGCTVHYVTEEVDAGAIITQKHVYVKKDDTVETLTERIKTAEHIAYPRALEIVARKDIC